jgi:hypothetical protein
LYTEEFGVDSCEKPASRARNPPMHATILPNQTLEVITSTAQEWQASKCMEQMHCITTRREHQLEKGSKRQHKPLIQPQQWGKTCPAAEHAQQPSMPTSTTIQLHTSCLEVAKGCDLRLMQFMQTVPQCADAHLWNNTWNIKAARDVEYVLNLLHKDTSIPAAAVIMQPTQCSHPVTARH